MIDCWQEMWSPIWTLTYPEGIRHMTSSIENNLLPNYFSYCMLVSKTPMSQSSDTSHMCRLVYSRHHWWCSSSTTLGGAIIALYCIDDVCCATIPFSSTTVDESREVGRQWRASPCHFSRTPYHTTGLTEGMISRHVAFVFFCFFPIFITLVKYKWGRRSILLIQTVKTLVLSVLRTHWP